MWGPWLWLHEWWRWQEVTESILVRQQWKLHLFWGYWSVTLIGNWAERLVHCVKGLKAGPGCATCVGTTGRHWLRQWRDPWTSATCAQCSGPSALNCLASQHGLTTKYSRLPVSANIWNALIEVHYLAAMIAQPAQLSDCNLMDDTVKAIWS